jgi:hypothetical protein
MKLEHHIAVSVPVSLGVFYFTRSIFYFLFSLAIGVLVDIDHIFDYIAEEKKFDLKHLFIKSYLGDFKKIYLFFHAYEYVPLAIFLGYYFKNMTFAFVFVISYLIHLIFDQFSNRTKPLGYFLIYRIFVKFEMKKIFNVPPGGIHKI